MPARFEPIVPDLSAIHEDPATTIRKLTDEVRKEADAIKGEYRKTTATWSSKNKPNFTVEAKTTSDGGFSITVSTKDTPFVFIDGGTSVRYRVMSSDFSPKTKPGVIGSFLGRGGPRGFGVRPGIQARRFSEIIAAQRQPEIVKRVVKVLSGAGAVI